MSHLKISAPAHLQKKIAQEAISAIHEMGGVIGENNTVVFSHPAKEEAKKLAESVVEPAEKTHSKLDVKPLEPQELEQKAIEETVLFKRSTNFRLSEGESIAGRVEYAGIAKNPRYKKNKASYCVILKSPEGLVRVWGTELETCVSATDTIVGETVKITKVKDFVPAPKGGAPKPAIFEIIKAS